MAKRTVDRIYTVYLLGPNHMNAHDSRRYAVVVAKEGCGSGLKGLGQGVVIPGFAPVRTRTVVGLCGPIHGVLLSIGNHVESVASRGVDGKPGHKVVHHAFWARKNVLAGPVAAAVVRVLVGHPGAIAVLFTKDQVQTAALVVHGNGHSIGAAKARDFVGPAPALGGKGDLVRKPRGRAIVVRTVEPQRVVDAPNDRYTAQWVDRWNGPFGRFVVIDAIALVGRDGYCRRPGDAAVFGLGIADARAVLASVRFTVLVKFGPGDVQGVGVGIHGDSLLVLVLGRIESYAASIAPGFPMVVAPLNDNAVQPISFLVGFSAGVGQMQEVDPTRVVVLQNGVAVHAVGGG